jgi:hypothetical protein
MEKMVWEEGVGERFCVFGGGGGRLCGSAWKKKAAKGV